MKEIETMLYEKKKEIDNIEVPEELEERLNKALEGKTVKRISYIRRMPKIAVACLVILLVGFNMDTLAYYGKRLIGYDTIMNGTLKDLNKMDKGQVIEESYTFKNGTQFTLDGIMIDESQLLAFYTVKYSKKVEIGGTPDLTIKGLYKDYHMGGGHGEIDEKNREIKYMMSFQTPEFYEKKLQLKIRIPGDNQEEGSISFELDRDKAMGYTLKKSINKSVELGNTKVKLEMLEAAPTQTIIRGSMQNIFELVKEKMSGQQLRAHDIEIKLMANGKEVNEQGSGRSTELNGVTFYNSFDALPSDLKTLKVILEKVSLEQTVEEQIELKVGEKDKSVEVKNQSIVINEVYEKEGSTFVTITTEQGTVLTSVYLNVDGEKVELEATEGDYKNEPGGKVIFTRTLRFPKVGKNYKLDIKKMAYTVSYNKEVDIPIN